MVQPLWKTAWRSLRKLKMELPYDPAIPLLGIYLEKTIIRKDTCNSKFIAALFTIAKTGKQLKFYVLKDEWIKKMWVKTVEQKDVYSLPLARAPESQLTAEQSLTGRCWNSPKKMPHIQRQRKSRNEMVGGAESK